MSGLALSSRGFSMEFKLQVSPSESTMEIIKNPFSRGDDDDDESSDNFNLSVRPSTSQLSLSVNGKSKSSSSCLALQSKEPKIVRRELGDNRSLSGGQ